MKINDLTQLFDLPLERYGLIAEFAHRMAERHLSFGKVALEKLVFFLQELYGVDCGYEFSLYTYGPFDSTLLGDLDATAALDGVDVKYYGSQGYEITPGTENEAMRKHAAELVAKHSEDLDRVIDEFGSLWARDLELFATIVYVERDARSSGQEPTVDYLVKVVNELKPHFSGEEIKNAVVALAERNHIKPTPEEIPRLKRRPRTAMGR